MPQVAANADIYADARQNIFFPGVVPSLDGQCVSLVKWFMQEMSEVPNPQAARGDARYVGKTLVAQGHAVEVPYADRKRGDIICYEYGTYGHIGIVLSADRTFEQNVNMGGVSRKLITADGESWYVYASRIGSLSEAWRNNQHIYRLKSYNEQGDYMLATPNQLKYLYLGVYAIETPDAILAKDPFVGTDFGVATEKVLDYANTKGIAYWQVKPKLEAEIAALKKKVAELQAQVGAEYVETKVYVRKGQ